MTKLGVNLNLHGFPTDVALYYMSCDSPRDYASSYSPQPMKDLMTGQVVLVRGRHSLHAHLNPTTHRLPPATHQVSTLKQLEVLDQDFVYRCGSEPNGKAVRDQLMSGMKANTLAANHTLAKLSELEGCDPVRSRAW